MVRFLGRTLHWTRYSKLAEYRSVHLQLSYPSDRYGERSVRKAAARLESARTILVDTFGLTELSSEPLCISISKSPHAQSSNADTSLRSIEVDALDETADRAAIVFWLIEGLGSKPASPVVDGVVGCVVQGLEQRSTNLA